MAAKVEGRQGMTRAEFVRGVTVAGGAGFLALALHGIEGWLSSIPAPARKPTPIAGETLPYHSTHTITLDQLPHYVGQRVRISLSGTQVTEPRIAQITDDTTHRSHPVLETRIGTIEGIVSAEDTLQPEKVYQALQSAASIEGAVFPPNAYSLESNGQMAPLGIFLNITAINPQEQAL